MELQNDTFFKTFDVSFIIPGFDNKQRARVLMTLENCFTVQDAKKELAKQDIFVTSIQRLDHLKTEQL